MPDKANEVDQAFSDDFGDFDFSERFAESESATETAAEDASGPAEEPEPEAESHEPPAEKKKEGTGAHPNETPSADAAPSEPAAKEGSDDKASGSDDDAPRETKGRATKGAAPAAASPKGASAKGTRPEGGGVDDEKVELEPNQTINQEGIIRERPTFYLRPDQMKAVRVAKAMRESPFGRDLSEIAMALFDLHGFGFEADRAKNDNYGYDAEDVLGRLVPEDQWEELLDAAREEEGRRASRNRLMYRVSRLIEDALYEAGYGDGRKRRKK